MSTRAPRGWCGDPCPLDKEAKTRRFAGLLPCHCWEPRAGIRTRICWLQKVQALNHQASHLLNAACAWRPPQRPGLHLPVLCHLPPVSACQSLGTTWHWPSTGRDFASLAGPCLGECSSAVVCVPDTPWMLLEHADREPGSRGPGQKPRPSLSCRLPELSPAPVRLSGRGLHATAAGSRLAQKRLADNCSRKKQAANNL